MPALTIAAIVVASVVGYGFVAGVAGTMAYRATYDDPFIAFWGGALWPLTLPLLAGVAAVRHLTAPAPARAARGAGQKGHAVKIKFHGASDDLVYFEATGNGAESSSDEWGAYGADDMVCATARVATIGGTRGVLVHAVYDGSWSFAVGLISDDCDNCPPLPPWSFTVGREHGYSTSLTIDTGDDVVAVTREDRK